MATGRCLACLKRRPARGNPEIQEILQTAASLCPKKPDESYRGTVCAVRVFHRIYNNKGDLRFLIDLLENHPDWPKYYGDLSAHNVARTECEDAIEQGIPPSTYAQLRRYATHEEALVAHFNPEISRERYYEARRPKQGQPGKDHEAAMVEARRVTSRKAQD